MSYDTAPAGGDPAPRPVERWLGRGVGTATFSLTSERVEALRAIGTDLAAAVASPEALFALTGERTARACEFVGRVAWAAGGGGDTIPLGGRSLTPEEFARVVHANDLFERVAEAVALAVLAAFPDSPAATALGLNPKKWHRRGRK